MNMNKISVNEAVKILRGGGVVVFPTDTVWGVGASVDSKNGVDKLYQAKKREKNIPTAVLVGSMDQAEKYGVFNKEAKELTKKNWPGALTVIVGAQRGIDKRILNSDGGVGIRYANSQIVRDLCEGIGGGIVASSANLAGEKTPKKLINVSKELLEKVDAVIYAPEQPSTRASHVSEQARYAASTVRGKVRCVAAGEGGMEGGLASTVVDCMGKKIKILRQGDIWV